MSENLICRRCHQPIKEGAVSGLCSDCLSYHALNLNRLQADYQEAIILGDPLLIQRRKVALSDYQIAEGVRLKDVPKRFRVD